MPGFCIVLLLTPSEALPAFPAGALEVGDRVKAYVVSHRVLPRDQEAAGSHRCLAGTFAAATDGRGGTRAGIFRACGLAPGAFAHFGQVSLTTPVNAGDIANLGVIVGEDAVAVVDTGGSVTVGEALYDAIRSITAKPYAHVINTHQHPDRQCSVRGLGSSAIATCRGRWRSGAIIAPAPAPPASCDGRRP